MEQSLMLVFAVLAAIVILSIWGPETFFFALMGAIVGTIVCFMFHGHPHPHGIINQNQNWNNLVEEILKLPYLVTFVVCGGAAGLMASISFKK